MELTEFEHQVAGHNDVFAIKGSDLIAKRCTRVEMLFYQQATGLLLEIIPKYYKTEQEYIIMENLVANMTNPCILDIKLGQRLFDDEATREKREKMHQKAMETTSHETGLKICGMQRFIDGKLIKYPREYGNQLKPYQLQGIILDFCKQFLNEIYKEILKIRDIVSQVSMDCYSASLLICYDANTLRVKLVDFAHSKLTNNGPDQGLLFALNNILKLLTGPNPWNTQLIKEGTNPWNTLIN